MPSGEHMKTSEHRARMSALTRGREPWNKGKRGSQVAWNKGLPQTAETKAKLSAVLKGRDILGDENRQKALAAHFSLDPEKARLTGRKISAAITGKPKMGRAAKGYRRPLEYRLALSVALKASQKAADQRARAQRTKGRTNIERAVAEVLDALGVEYEQQRRIGRYCVDFYVRSHNQIIEVDGEYWHSLPKQIEHDQKRDAELVALGYNVVRVPGAAIKRDARAALEAAWRL